MCICGLKFEIKLRAKSRTLISRPALISPLLSCALKPREFIIILPSASQVATERQRFQVLMDPQQQQPQTDGSGAGATPASAEAPLLWSFAQLTAVLQVGDKNTPFSHPAMSISLCPP